jgi:hypothetical protein
VPRAKLPESQLVSELHNGDSGMGLRVTNDPSLDIDLRLTPQTYRSVPSTSCGGLVYISVLSMLHDVASAEKQEAQH